MPGSHSTSFSPHKDRTVLPLSRRRRRTFWRQLAATAPLRCTTCGPAKPSASSSCRRAPTPSRGIPWRPSTSLRPRRTATCTATTCASWAPPPACTRYGVLIETRGAFARLRHCNLFSRFQLAPCRERLPLLLQDFVSAVMDVDFSPTGREFAAGSYDRSLRIFAYNGGHSREVYHTKRMQRVFAVRFSGDASYVYSGSDDMNVRIWKVRSVPRYLLNHPASDTGTTPSASRGWPAVSSQLRFGCADFQHGMSSAAASWQQNACGSLPELMFLAALHALAQCIQTPQHCACDTARRQTPASSGARCCRGRSRSRRTTRHWWTGTSTCRRSAALCATATCRPPSTRCALSGCVSTKLELTLSLQIPLGKPWTTPANQ